MTHACQGVVQVPQRVLGVVTKEDQQGVDLTTSQELLNHLLVLPQRVSGCTVVVLADVVAIAALLELAVCPLAAL